MTYVYTKIITGSASNLDKIINNYLEKDTAYPEVLDIKIIEITKSKSTSQFLALLILQGE